MTTVKARNGQLRPRRAVAIVARRQLMFHRGAVDGEKQLAEAHSWAPYMWYIQTPFFRVYVIAFSCDFVGYVIRR